MIDAGELHLAKLSVLNSGASRQSISSFGLLLQHFAGGNLLRHGLQLHSRLVLLSVIPGNFLASKLISWYSRSGRLTDARFVFDSIPFKNLFSWNAMLLAYSINNQTDSFISLFSAFPPSLRPDPFTISALLKTVPSAGKQIHAAALRLFCFSDPFVPNGLITAYMRNGDANYARKVFDGMPVRDVVSWNSIIAGLSQEGWYSDCIRLYEELEQGKDGLMPNGITVASVLQACSQLGDVGFGIGVHEFAVRNGMGNDIVVGNAAVGLHARCGSLERARVLFDEMPERDGVTYSTMISGYMGYGFINQAMELFHHVPNPVLSTWNAVICGLVQNNSFHLVLDLFQAMQNAGFKPNSVTISSVLPAVSFLSSLRTVTQIHWYAVRNGCDQNVYVATALIDAYGKAGFPDGARRVFDLTGAGTTSVIIWTAIISAYSIRGDADSALSIFRRMVARGIEPDPVTFTAVLSACAHCGDVDEARRILNVSMPEFGISPEAEQYACVVGALSRKGMLVEAAETIKRMPFPPSSKAWGALLNGAAVHRDVEIGEHAFGRLAEIEPDNSGNYIVMANLYSQAGKWKEAQMVRKKMEEVGLGKVPGCSWIEGNNGRMQVFISSDMNNEHCREAFELIDELVGLMREEGYLAAKEELDEECCC